MFNICANCGEFTDEKLVDAVRGTATCPVCGYESAFRSLPLYVITGASGSGKSAAALRLLNLKHEFVILDQDILWSDAFNNPDGGYRLFRNTWLRVAKNIHQSGKSVVLFGSAIPEQYEGCTERRYFSAVHYLALVCDPDQLRKRLEARPGWRNSSSPENVRNMLDFNQWLRDNAARTLPPMTVLDTTEPEVGETAAAILHWLKTVH